MASADVAFNSADVNNDGTIDQGEFRRFVGGSGVGSGYGAGASYGGGSYGGGASYGGASYGAGLGGGVQSYESSSYESSSGGLGGGYGGAAGYGGGASYGGGYDAGYGGAASSSYESSSYSSGGGAGYGAGYGAAGGVNIAALQAGNFSGIQGLSQETQTVRYTTDSQGLFQDSNPQIIRRPAPQGPQTYTQNIRVRFLQPPQVPPPGPLIIREVRPPQAPAPPPLRIRQQAPPLPTPPPLVLRERPPQVPQSIASQTVIRRLQALPVPPRSVIIERLPPLPPRPRDIVIERWVPYGPQQQRRTIVQRAAAAQQYQAPRNVIIQYEPVQARIVRQFQRLGVTPENPAAYIARYGGSLLDAGALIAQARSAGVVEDIAPGAVGYSGAVYGQQDASYAAQSSYSGYEGGAGYASGAGYGSGAGLGGGYSEQSYSSESVSGGLGGGYGAAGYGASGLGGQSYESSSSYSSGAGAGTGNLTYPIGLDVGVAGFVQNPASYERFQASSGLEQHGYGVGGDVAIGAPDLSSRVSQYDAAGSMFNYADVNHDGRIDRNEFGSFMRSV